MTLLALDLGLATGYALFEGKLYVGSGVANFKPKRFEGGGMRFLRFRRWLDEAKPSEIAFEEVRAHAGTDAAHSYGGFLATLTSWCEEHGVPYAGIPVSVVKKQVTGKGNAPKALVIACLEAAGFDPEDDNEADAIGVGLSHLGVALKDARTIDDGKDGSLRAKDRAALRG